MRSVDFNCDLGEESGEDAAILPWISSASIACGMHAGGPETMQASVAACIAHGVAIGAHPGFDDRAHFGRRALPLSLTAVHALVLYQVGALAAFARVAGARLQHVKPHGALYNMAAVDHACADAIATAVLAFDPALRLYALSGSALSSAGRAAGLEVVEEVFAERRYEEDGTLTPRTHPTAVIDDIGQAAQQVVAMLRTGRVVTRTGSELPIRADTVCLHGDRPDAARFAEHLRAAIEAEGIAVRAPGATAAGRSP